MDRDIKYLDFKQNPSSYFTDIPELTPDLYNLILGDAFYDGYLNGFIEHLGKCYIFQIISDSETGFEPRIFAVCNTSQSEIDNEKQQHDNFERLLKENPNIRDESGNLTPFWKNYYADHPVDEDFKLYSLNERQVVFWFRN